MTLLVRIETSNYGLVTAKIHDDPELQATDPTREGAVRALKKKLQTMIEEGKLSSIEVDVPLHWKQA